MSSKSKNSIFINKGKVCLILNIIAFLIVKKDKESKQGNEKPCLSLFRC